MLRPRCWSGRKSTLRLGRRVERPPERACALDEVQMVPPCRPVNALMAAAEFMYVTGTVDVGDAGVGQHVPGVLDLVDRRHVRHGAAGREVREDHLLVVGREDVGATRP